MAQAWPSEVAPIELSWETTDTVEEFTVTWQYSWFTAKSKLGGPTNR